MTTYHLNFWSKSCGSVQIQRIYVNAADRSSPGYFEMRVGTAERGTDSNYDRHRLTKGDTTVETVRSFATTLPTDVMAAIYAIPSIAAAIEAQKIGDDFSRFSALVSHARGVTVIPYHSAKSAAGRAERKAIKERQACIIEI